MEGKLPKPLDKVGCYPYSKVERYLVKMINLTTGKTGETVSSNHEKSYLKGGKTTMSMRDGHPSPDFYIRNLATAIRLINDQKLLAFGITNQQARLLGAIRRSLYDGVNISRKYLEELMGIRGPSVTNLLNALLFRPNYRLG